MAESTRTRVNNKKKDRRLIKITLLYPLLMLVLFGSLLLFMAFWEDKSNNVTFQVEPQYQFANGTRVVTQKATIIIENYYPLTTRSFSPFIQKYIEYQGHETTQEIENTPQNLKGENITIEQMTWKLTYGDAEILPPLTLINPDTLSEIKTVGMSRNTITIIWKYELTENASSPYVHYRLNYNMRKVNEFSLRQFSPFWVLQFSIPLSYRELALDVFFFLSWALAGFFFSWTALWDRSNLKEAYRDLKKFDYRTTPDATHVNELSNNLKTLKYVPNRLGSFYRLTLGLSLLIFKVQVANWSKKHRDECALQCREKFEKEFSQHVDILETKVSDFIPEKQTILILLGFLTSVGVSFSFNVGALAPFLYSIGVFYVFLNIGSTFYLLGKSKDAIWPTIFLLVAILAVSFPALLTLLRGLQ